MTDIRLSTDDWTKIRNLLRQGAHAYVGGDVQTCRRFVEAMKWISRNSAQWRLLPLEFELWNGVQERFARWHQADMWERLFTALA